MTGEAPEGRRRLRLTFRRPDSILRHRCLVPERPGFGPGGPSLPASVPASVADRGRCLGGAPGVGAPGEGVRRHRVLRRGRPGARLPRAAGCGTRSPSRRMGSFRGSVRVERYRLPGVRRLVPGRFSPGGGRGSVGGSFDG